MAFDMFLFQEDVCFVIESAIRRADGESVEEV